MVGEDYWEGRFQLVRGRVDRVSGGWVVWGGSISMAAKGDGVRDVL